MSMHDDELSNPLDQATADRLARLRTTPVDTSRLDALLSRQIPRPMAAADDRGAQVRPFAWWRPLRAVAAVIVLGAVLAGSIYLATSARPVMASSGNMIQMHRDLVSGRVPVVKVESIEDASRELNSQWPNSPDLPDVPEEHVMACCMKSVRNKKVALVLLNRDNTPVTMAVARAQDMRLPVGPTVTRDGITYHVEMIGALTMVSTEREGRFVCLIGETTQDRLMDLASAMKF